jgi:hypothetical protein
MTTFSQTLFPLADMSRELAALVTERHDDALEMFECDFECGLVELTERPTFDEHVQELFDAVRRDASDIPLWIEETVLPQRVQRELRRRMVAIGLAVPFNPDAVSSTTKKRRVIFSLDGVDYEDK